MYSRFYLKTKGCIHLGKNIDRSDRIENGDIPASYDSLPEGMFWGFVGIFLDTTNISYPQHVIPHQFYSHLFFLPIEVLPPFQRGLG